MQAKPTKVTHAFIVIIIANSGSAHENRYGLREIYEVVVLYHPDLPCKHSTNVPPLQNFEASKSVE